MIDPEFDRMMRGVYYHPLVTIDLDSTIADTGHRHHMIDRENGTDWHAYAAACVDDMPIAGMVALVRILVAQGVEVHALSGRKVTSLEATKEWFAKHEIPVEHFWMDETDEGDYVAGRTHADFKVERALEVQRILGRRISLHIDDYPSVARRFEESGIPTICVRTPQEMADGEVR